MAATKPLTAAEQLRRHIDVVSDIIERFEDRWRLTARTDGLIAEVEQASVDLRAIVRGRAA